MPNKWRCTNRCSLCSLMRPIRAQARHTAFKSGTIRSREARWVPAMTSGTARTRSVALLWQRVLSWPCGTHQGSGPFVLDARPASYDRPTRAAVLRPGRLLGCSLKRDPIEWTTRCGVQMLNGSIWRRNRNEYSRVACWALPRRLLLRSAVAARRTTDCGTRLWLWDRWTRGM
eukprot:COSAG02_NODE_221_length_28385_cov_5.795164_17_plen_173_part_00